MRSKGRPFKKADWAPSVHEDRHQPHLLLEAMTLPSE